MVVLEVLGVALWAVLGLLGAWFLVTGRNTKFGLPNGMREGWPTRMMGLAYVLLTGFLIYQVFHGDFAADGVVISYVFFAVAIAVYVRDRRKAQAADASTPEA
jgi:hypothetical protein